MKGLGFDCAGQGRCNTDLVPLPYAIVLLVEALVVRDAVVAVCESALDGPVLGVGTLAIGLGGKGVDAVGVVFGESGIPEGNGVGEGGGEFTPAWLRFAGQIARGEGGDVEGGVG